MLLAALLLAQAAPIAAPAVPDPELADMRGGLRLPSGVDVAITVDTRTAVDGAMVLRTVFRADQGPATMTVYTPKPGETVAMDRPTVGGRTVAAPVVTYDNRSGVRITQGAPMPSAAIFAGRNGTGEPQGLEVAPAGAVAEAARGGVRTVQLARDDLTVTHFAGGAIGSAIANMGSDRTIDTQTTIAIDLRNAGAEIMGNALVRVENVALEAARARF